jgi:hypothetical protein
MTDDTAVKIAALVAELGKLRTEIAVEPTDEQALRMRTVCTGKQAADALHLALGVVLETTDNVAAVLVDISLLCAAVLAPLHKDNTDTHKVSRAEVLRRLATSCDASDKLRGTIDTLLELIGAPRPSESKPGSN